MWAPTTLPWSRSHRDGVGAGQGQELLGGSSTGPVSGPAFARRMVGAAGCPHSPHTLSMVPLLQDAQDQPVPALNGQAEGWYHPKHGVSGTLAGTQRVGR